MKNTFTEDTRVKIPALIHLTRLGYIYISQKEHYKRNEETNIFPDIFKESLRRINSDNISDDDLDRLLNDITFELDNQDLGEAFYKRLSSGSGIRLIDFENFNNNSFHVTTELSCVNGADEFRPDITVFINGMPLSFIEVKKPNNKDGILVERTRINKRYANRKFRRFANITQLMIFSNNSEYQDGVIEPIQGAYYATSSYKKLKFNYFREDPDYPVKERLQSLDEKTELFILKDSNQIVIKDNIEFNTNKHYDTPTNRILTSMLSRERLSFILRYALVYVHEKGELGEPIVQKHIMRYPQLFATIAIGAKLDQGIRKGIIWHTQGSGKTALAYYNVKYLTDYYQKQNVIPKFFFIVDRLDLLKQASKEFSNRGLKVNEVNSRQDFIRNIKRVAGLQNSLGIPEITVVNIQKFSEESSVVELTDYDINTQCIYFLDEAHRSYNPKGDYLAKLLKSDKNAIKIALTGTPLLKEVAKEYDSKKLFGDYIHKYYYNMSIADGYTLRLIREQIENKFKMEMQHVLESIRVKQGEFSKAELYAKPKFVKPLLKYITNDLIRFKRDSGDYSLGGMVICDSAEQAKELFKQFELEYGDQEIVASRLVAEERDNYNSSPKLRAALILHDENDTEIRTELIEAFKASKIDILFVYNMLLTGFSANNLKKLYVNRVIKDHNLLQALTRVNRPFKDFRYGYVVDFADISNAFDRTNRLYYEELQDQLGDDFEYYNHIFKSREEIDNELLDIKEVLFHYDIEVILTF
ncbi:type I restriction endonuclease [Myroides marinus]|uniref:type I restriction endonuclease n=1 Tax=Myroides marinus TaxID=703342 RepID=UPI002577FABD|nr:type I restriction endonuclease [Myroides marinus]MDM1375233.1 type I restriction endonuclease subunit R [Myroides marinus]